MKYDADKPLNAKEWLAEDEDVRIRAIMQHHKKLKFELPNPRLHAAIHGVIENQLAEGITQVKTKLDELKADGLDRHNAIHAMGSIQTEMMYDLMNEPEKQFDEEKEYYNRLSKLTAKGWLEKYSDL